LDLASLVRAFEERLREARAYCKMRCVGREACFKKCIQKEKKRIQLDIEEKFGIKIEVI